MTLADYGILVAITVVVLLVVPVPYLALVAKARWVLKSPWALKLLNRAAAIAARQHAPVRNFILRTRVFAKS